MSNLKLSGNYHRIFRGEHGLYGVETVTLKDGKVINVEVMSPNYPTVTMAKFGKRAMAEAHELLVAEDFAK